MKKIKINFDKIAVVAALSGFVFSAVSCEKGNKDGGSTDTSFTAEEVKIIKENLLKDGMLEKNSYTAVINAIAPVQGLNAQNITEAINKGDSTTLGILVNCGVIAVKGDKSGYELDPKLVEAKKLTPEAVEFANSFSKFLKLSTAFNAAPTALKIHVGANTCNVIAVGA